MLSAQALTAVSAEFGAVPETNLATGEDASEAEVSLRSNRKQAAGQEDQHDNDH